MTHKSKHNKLRWIHQVGENPGRARFSTETPLKNADVKFSASNGEGDDSNIA